MTQASHNPRSLKKKESSKKPAGKGSAAQKSKATRSIFPPPQGEWTYDDYARLPDNGYRYEVIKGNLYMTPAPNWFHQTSGYDLARMISAYLDKRQSGRVIPSPIDVIFPETADPVQPDVIVILKENLDILAASGRIEGVPNIIIEVLSPRTRKHDTQTKFDLYLEAGVPEYWMVDPESKSITVNVRRGDAWAPVVFEKDDELRSEILPEFSLPVASIFKSARVHE